jgi:hypothetical protein
VELSFSTITILKSGEGKEKSGVVIPALLKSAKGKEESGIVILGEVKEESPNTKK